MMTERAKKLKRILENAAAQGRLVITGHDSPDVDSVASCALMLALCTFWKIDARVLIPTRADGQSRRVLPPMGMQPDMWRGDILESDRLILVDHHAPLHPGMVVACVDHHPTDFPPAYPFLLIEDDGACAAMVLRLMREADMPVTQAQEALAVMALYLDTMALRSAKITAEEAAWGRREAKRLGMDEALLEREGLKLEDMTLSAAVLAHRGEKRYTFGDNLVCSTYIQTDALTPELKNEILDILRGALTESGAALWVFIHHDPIRLFSVEYDLLPDGTTREIRYDHLASRGKEVMPRVEREIREEHER